ncbi:MAG: c-type cytochrome, partial [Rhodospirillaceae bacterium]|nr:c-type cytochrome [Rhodospirillaceae bacterium]
VIGSIIFAAAVLLFINVAGNVLVGQPSVESSVEPSAPSNDKAEAVQPEEKAEVATAAPENAPSQSETPLEATTETAPATEKTMVASSSGNAEMGADTFRRKCMGCHPISEDGQNRTGPNLFGVVGRAKASIDGYRYSSALEKLGGTWTESELNTFIAGPRVMVPDTKMTFSGVKKEDQRDDIVAYLKTLSK